MSDGKNTRENTLTCLWVVAFAALAVLHRLVPYLFDMGQAAPFAWNFASVGAFGLFAGARWRSGFAFLAPVAVMLVSHLLMWPFLVAENQPTFNWNTAVLYGSFMVYPLIGRFLGGTSSPLWIAAGAFLGALQFYLITNFSCWAGGDGLEYAKNLAGLTQCFALGLPFFGNTLGGDLAFSGLFFGLHALSLHAFQSKTLAIRVA